MMNLKPINRNILVELIKEEERTAGGLYIPFLKEEAAIQTAVVQAACTTTSIRVGDKLVFKKHSGIKISDNQLIINQDDILGLIE